MEKSDIKQSMSYESYANVVVLLPPPYRQLEEDKRCSHKYTTFKRSAVLFTSFLSIILSIGLTVMTIFTYERDLYSAGDYNTLASPKIMLTRRSGGPFVEKGYFWIVVAIAIVLFILVSICATYWCCRGSFKNPLCFPCYALACCGIVQCAEVCCVGAIGGAAMADS